VSTEEIRKIKEKYEKQLLDIPGVTGIGLNGSVILYVSKKTAKTMSFIPKTLDGVPVTVIETGIIRPLSFPVVSAVYADRTARYRPMVPGGVSVGAPDITAGTLTGRLLRKDGIYGLSNSHVLSGAWGTHPASAVGTPILQPGIFDGGKPSDEIGTLEKWIPVKLDEPNLVDAAIFKSDMLSEDILDVGKPGQTIEPKAGMMIKKSGRSSGLTYSRLIDVDATLRVSGWGEATFTDVCVARPANGIPGDSGSWGGSENDNTFGVLFAGSPEVTIYSKALNVEKLLGGEIIPPLPVLGAKSLLPWGGVFLGGVVMGMNKH